jgi:hypothetical protein
VAKPINTRRRIFMLALPSFKFIAVPPFNRHWLKSSRTARGWLAVNGHLNLTWKNCYVKNQEPS